MAIPSTTHVDNVGKEDCQTVTSAYLSYMFVYFSKIDTEIARIGEKHQDLVLQQQELTMRQDQVQHIMTTWVQKMAKPPLQISE